MKIIVFLIGLAVLCYSLPVDQDNEDEQDLALLDDDEFGRRIVTRFRHRIPNRLRQLSYNKKGRTETTTVEKILVPTETPAIENEMRDVKNTESVKPESEIPLVVPGTDPFLTVIPEVETTARETPVHEPPASGTVDILEHIPVEDVEQPIIKEPVQDPQKELVLPDGVKPESETPLVGPRTDPFVMVIPEVETTAQKTSVQEPPAERPSSGTVDILEDTPVEEIEQPIVKEPVQDPQKELVLPGGVKPESDTPLIVPGTDPFLTVIPEVETTAQETSVQESFAERPASGTVDILEDTPVEEIEQPIVKEPVQDTQKEFVLPDGVKWESDTPLVVLGTDPFVMVVPDAETAAQETAVQEPFAERPASGTVNKLEHTPVEEIAQPFVNQDPQKEFLFPDDLEPVPTPPVEVPGTFSLVGEIFGNLSVQTADEEISPQESAAEISATGAAREQTSLAEISQPFIEVSVQNHRMKFVFPEGVSFSFTAMFQNLGKQNSTW